MAGPVCVQCGQPLAESARFCGHCGATQPVAGARTLPSAGVSSGAATVFDHGPPAALKSTVLGTTSPLQAAPPPVAPAPAPPAVLLNKQTMIGVASPLASAFAAPMAQSSPAAPAPAPLAPVAAPGGHKTMLGVAATAMAPDRGPLPALAPAAGARPQTSPEPPKRPAVMTVALQVAYVPPPAALPELRAPPPPVVVKKGGVPLTMVALIAGGVLLVGGVAIALLWKGAPPMTAKALSGSDGNDVLHLTCDAKSCPDGTLATLATSRATFTGGQADLVMPAPLHLGDNDVTLQVERPGMGRSEAMKFVVPVDYRVKADVGTMSAPKPAITIRVEARPGTDVKVDGKPVALDANGAGAYAVDESAAAEGPADESRVVSLDLPYAVTPQAGSNVVAETGTVGARVAVSPLRVDAPGPIAVVEDDHVLVAGRGPKGASVTLDGNVVPVAADGSFETTLALPAPGDHVAEVRGGTPALMPRTIHLTLTRVSSLADAAKTFEQTQHPIGYDVAMGDIAGKTGQPIVVEGPVLESRASGHRTLVLVDDKRGCKKGPCHARVVVGRDLALAPGDILHAYGVVARGFTTPAGQTVPEIDSEFALRTRH